MSIYKLFTTTDVLVTPFEVNKSFSFQGNELTSSNISIERYIGQNILDSVWSSTSNATGQSTLLNKQLVYNSIKQLYYTNFLSNALGSKAVTSSIGIDGVRRGGYPQTNYYNYLSSTTNINRTFTTESNSKIGIISIPSNLFGEYLNPGSFVLSSPSGSIIDDTEGNLLFSSSIHTVSSQHVGNIIYEHGMAILISESLSPYTGSFGSFINSTNITCSFKSNITIFESQYKCTARPSEFLFSQNPTIISGSNSCPENVTSKLYGFATGSYFTPYVTTVGLYNNDKELVAVGKLAQPLDMSDTTDTTILINLDL
jgi:hypothetical protein